MSLPVSFVLIVGLLLSQATFAIDRWQYKLDVGYGKRTDNLSYQTEGLMNAPLAGETTQGKISNVAVHEMILGYRFIGDQSWYVKGYHNQGWVYLGKESQNSHPNGLPSQPWATFEHSGVRGSTQDSSFSFGHQWRWQDSLALTPLIGYSRHQQNWRLNNAHQNLCQATGVQTCLLAQGQASQDIGHWDSTWSGPWIGLDARINTGNMTFLLEWEHHLAHYDATLIWQGNQSLANQSPIKQAGSAVGDKLGFGASYSLHDGFISMNFSSMDLRYVNGYQKVSNTSQIINKGGWDSRSINFSYTALF
jgi:hypothetical protein